MPIYEYRCLACERAFEVLQKVGEAPLSKCLSCGSNKVEKLISTFAVRVRDGLRETSNGPAIEREPHLEIDATVPRTFQHPNMGFRPVVRGELPRTKITRAKKG
jgi:putative FmdB family regulatory protein